MGDRDEEDLLELVNYNLAKEGYRVHCVASGEEALGFARAYPGRSALTLLAIVLAGLTEGLSLGTILPLLSTLEGAAGSSDFGDKLVALFEAVGITPSVGALITVAG